jgi:dolichol-phosphate mannosyltransferase
VAELVLSAVVACYKDAQAIPLMHQRLTRVLGELGVGYEIIFVNDGSPDDTDVVLEQLTDRDDHVIAIEHSRNFGSQNAFLSGLEVAIGDAAVLLDGDLQDPPELISAFYSRWQEGYSVVYGRRTRREGSRSFALLARAFYRTFRRASEVPIPLDAGDFALIDRQVVDELLALPETDQFLRGLRAWVGFRQTGVDYLRPKRAFGRSTHSFGKNFWWAKKAIFSFSFLPIETLGYAAGLMTAVSFGALVYQLSGLLMQPNGSLGLTEVATLIAFFGSLQLLAIALIGEYLAKVLEETKRRPKFIRKAIRIRGQHLTSTREIEQLLLGRPRAGVRKGGTGVTS